MTTKAKRRVTSSVTSQGNAGRNDNADPEMVERFRVAIEEKLAAKRRVTDAKGRYKKPSATPRTGAERQAAFRERQRRGIEPPAYKRFQPHPRKYSSDAEKQRAYRLRKKEKE